MKTITTTLTASIVTALFVLTPFVHASEISGTLSTGGPGGHDSSGNLSGNVTGGSNGGGGGLAGNVTGGSSGSRSGSRSGGNSGSVSGSGALASGGVGGSQDFSSGGSSFGAQGSQAGGSDVSVAAESEDSVPIDESNTNQVAAVSDSIFAGMNSPWFWFSTLFALVAASVVYAFIKYRQLYL
jgi:hypothetical protein